MRVYPTHTPAQDAFLSKLKEYASKKKAGDTVKKVAQALAEKEGIAGAK